MMTNKNLKSTLNVWPNIFSRLVEVECSRNATPRMPYFVKLNPERYGAQVARNKTVTLSKPLGQKKGTCLGNLCSM